MADKRGPISYARVARGGRNAPHRDSRQHEVGLVPSTCCPVTGQDFPVPGQSGPGSTRSWAGLFHRETAESQVSRNGGRQPVAFDSSRAPDPTSSHARRGLPQMSHQQQQQQQMTSSQGYVPNYYQVSPSPHPHMNPPPAPMYCVGPQMCAPYAVGNGYVYPTSPPMESSVYHQPCLPPPSQHQRVYGNGGLQHGCQPMPPAGSPVIYPYSQQDQPPHGYYAQSRQSASNVSLKIVDFPPSTSVENNDGQLSNDWNRAVAKLERENQIRAKIGLVINKRYQVLHKINVGSYGQLYTALDLMDPLSRQVAIKFESSGIEDSHIRYEYEVFKVCSNGPHSKKEKSTIGFPQVYWVGQEYDYKVMVMELLGPSLENLFGFCSNQFKKETVYDLGCQMLDRVEHLHSRGFVHRDLKPENLLMGIGNNENTCYLIDFGLARRYRFRDGNKLTHIPYRKGKHLVGTAKYASLNSHNGIELSRRDDMESLGYILLEFMTGGLPWKESRARARYRSKQQSYNRIRTLKEQMDWEHGCPALVQWMRYAKGLRFEEKPDYNRFRGFLRDFMEGRFEREEDHRCEMATHLEGLAIGEEGAATPAANGGGGVCTLNETAAVEEKTENRGETGDEKVTGNGLTATSNKAPGDLAAVNGKKDNGDDAAGSVPATPTSVSGLSRAAASRVAANRFDWLERRERDANEKYTYQCMYRWTLPYGEKPELPPNHKSSMSFGYGFGEGGFA